MSKLITFSVGAIVALLTQQAAVAAENIMTEPAVQTIDLPAHRLQMDSATISKFIGIYELSNGDELKIIKRGQTLYASLGSDDFRHAVVASGRNTFVSLDKQLKIHIEHVEDEKVSGEVYIAGGSNGIPYMASLR